MSGTLAKIKADRSKVRAHLHAGSAEPAVAAPGAHGRTPTTRALGSIYPIVLLVVTGLIAVTSALMFRQPNSIQVLPAQVVSQPVCGTWQIMLTPSSYRSVAVLSESDVWFAGMRGDSSSKSGPAFARWNGTSLITMPSQDLGAQVIDITALAVRTAQDAWAVGYVLEEDTNRPVSFHWDGKEWALVPMPALPANNVNSMTGVPDRYAELQAVTIVSENDVWAVGHYPQSGVSTTLVLHWSGTEWKVVASPNVSGTDNYLYAVVSISEDDIWALGHTGDSPDKLPSLALHWDSESWQVADAPNLGPIIAASLDASKTLWVLNNVPTGGNPLASAVRRVGSMTWDEVPIPQLEQPALRSISALSTNNIWAVGVKWSGYPSGAKPNEIATRSLVMHWDGSNWTEVPGPDPAPIQSLEAVAVSPNSDVWIVGASADNKDSLARPMVSRFITCSKPPAR